MMLDRRLVAGLAALWAASTATAAVCTSNLMIDNFVKWTAGTNNLDYQNGGQSTSIVVPRGGLLMLPQMTGP